MWTELVLQAAPSPRLEREQRGGRGGEERSERCFVVNTFYDPSLTGISSEHFRGKLIFLKKNVWEKKVWGTELNSKTLSIFWVRLAGFLSFLFLSVQFNSVRCWSWSEFKYYRKETSSHQRKTSHIHLSPSSSHLCCDLTYDRPRLTRSGSNSGQNCFHTLLLIEKHNWLIFPVVYSRLSRLFRMKNE